MNQIRSDSPRLRPSCSAFSAFFRVLHSDPVTWRAWELRCHPRVRLWGRRESRRLCCACVRHTRGGEQHRDRQGRAVSATMCRLLDLYMDTESQQYLHLQQHAVKGKPEHFGPAFMTDDEGHIFKTDSFMMYCMKVLPCPNQGDHNWAECPYAHPGERAARRNPRTCQYTGIVCPDMRKAGQCPRRDACPFAHNELEYWLHPTRYRTAMCPDGDRCTRTVCFFAHSPDELRGLSAAPAAKGNMAASDSSQTPAPSGPCADSNQAGEDLIHQLSLLLNLQPSLVKSQLQEFQDQARVMGALQELLQPRAGFPQTTDNSESSSDEAGSTSQDMDLSPQPGPGSEGVPAAPGQANPGQQGSRHTGSCCDPGAAAAASGPDGGCAPAGQPGSPHPDSGSPHADTGSPLGQPGGRRGFKRSEPAAFMLGFAHGQGGGGVSAAGPSQSLPMGAALQAFPQFYCEPLPELQQHLASMRRWLEDAEGCALDFDLLTELGGS